jgi:ABC-type amino acid transport system permease subunit
MLELIMLICLLLVTVMAFWKKGLVAGLVMGLAFLLSLVGAFMPRPHAGSFPISVVFTLLAMIVLFFGLFKYFRKENINA